MGIKHFFYWFKNRYPECISSFPSYKTLKQHLDIGIDVLGIDLNGIFHNSVNAIHLKENGSKTDLDVFKKVCFEIDSIVKVVQPEKILILCVDGVAGFAKMFQQRQRRFKAAMENQCKTFDRNCITPGTEFMDKLSNYIDFHIKKNLFPNHKIKIIFSNDKVPGEGEHKIIRYMKKHCNADDRFCIYGLDSDLFMLSLSTHYSNIFILRENTQLHNYSTLINIGEFSESLKREMKTDDCVDDFIFLSFFSGNDFIPNIPTEEISEGSFDRILCNYFEITSKKCGKMINIKKDMELNISSFKAFIEMMASLEKEIMINRFKTQFKCTPDTILEKSISYRINGGEKKIHFNLEKYKKEYYIRKFGESYNIQEICTAYLKSMYWTILYYIKEIPDWNWYYPYFYAPFASDLLQYLAYFPMYKFHINKPVCPFIQLLSVLPPQSKNILPYPLNELFEDPDLKEYYPSNFKIDMEGKRNDWEGIVILPNINIQLLKTKFSEAVKRVDQLFLKRNERVYSIEYTYNDKEYIFTCEYGKIDVCKVKNNLLKI